MSKRTYKYNYQPKEERVKIDALVEKLIHILSGENCQRAETALTQAKKRILINSTVISHSDPGDVLR